MGTRINALSISTRMRTIMRVRLVLIAVALIGPTATAALAVPRPRLPGHALLVDEPGLRVYGPALHPTTPCPHLLPQPPDALRTVKRAIEVATPPFEKLVHLDGLTRRRAPQRRAAPLWLRARLARRIDPCACVHRRVP
jgi:hypothetical protein